MRSFITLTFLLLLAVSALCATGDKTLFGISGPQSFDNLPTQFDMIMVAGDDYTLDLRHVDNTGTAINLTGSTFYAQFRTLPFTGSILLANYSTPIVNAATGRSRVSLSRRQTLPLSGASGIWDLLHIDSTGKRKYRMGGKVTIVPKTTQGP
jgi:hypothetical protein